MEEVCFATASEACEATSTAPVTDEGEVFFATNRAWDGFAFGSGPECESGGGEGHFGRGREGRVQLMERSTFFDILGGFKKLVFFSHGFNNAFDSAIRNFVVYSKLLNLSETAFILLSWPSKGHLEKNHPIATFFLSDSPYVCDQHNARQSGRFFADVISTAAAIEPQEKKEIEIGVAKEKGVRVTVIAHSMGAQMVWSAFQFLDTTQKPRVSRVILVAADLHLRDVEEHIGDHFGAGVSVIHYFCTKDIALKFAAIIGKSKCIGAQSIGGVVNIEIPKKVAKKNGAAMHSYAMHELVIDDVSRQCVAKNCPDFHNLIVKDNVADGWLLKCARNGTLPSGGSSATEELRE